MSRTERLIRYVLSPLGNILQLSCGGVLKPLDCPASCTVVAKDIERTATPAVTSKRKAMGALHGKRNSRVEETVVSTTDARGAIMESWKCGFSVVQLGAHGVEGVTLGCPLLHPFLGWHG